VVVELENLSLSKDESSQILLDKEETSSFDWIISADKIFSSSMEGFTDFAKFFNMEFHVSRFSLFDGSKSSDSAVSARDVKIYIGSGRHCAMLQGRMAKGVVIPKITIKKVTRLMGEIATLEVKEFEQCLIQSFSVIGKVSAFSFRYSSYSDSYTDFKEDGTKLGTAATQIDLAKWEIKDS